MLLRILSARDQSVSSKPTFALVDLVDFFPMSHLSYHTPPTNQIKKTPYEAFCLTTILAMLL
jgi:hypothetical protein